jgi:hypothetical protein
MTPAQLVIASNEGGDLMKVPNSGLVPKEAKKKGKVGISSRW